MRIPLFILTIALIAGCESKSSSTIIQNLHSFPWIQNIVGDHPNAGSNCKLVIFIGSYKGQNVIYWDYKGELCETAGPTELYDSDGVKIKTFTTLADFKDRNANLIASSVLRN